MLIYIFGPITQKTWKFNNCGLGGLAKRNFLKSELVGLEPTTWSLCAILPSVQSKDNFKKEIAENWLKTSLMNGKNLLTAIT